MTAVTFNTVTDWIGITTLVAAVALLMLPDVVSSGAWARASLRTPVQVAAVVAALAVIALRFVVMV